MSKNREKTSSVMGITVSVLLHGIFFAGCLALDANQVSDSAIPQETKMDMQTVDNATTHPEIKS